MKTWLGLLFGAGVAATAWGQTPTIPRTHDGHPDFTGAWTSSFITSLERMPGASSLVVGEADARKLGEEYYQRLLARENGLDPDVLAANVRNLLRVGNDYRTSLVVEPASGMIPFTAEGRQLVDAARKRAPDLPDDPEFRPESERCIAGHGRTPLSLTPTVNSRQVVQTTQHFVLYSEDGPDVRIIPLGGSHRPLALASWGGDSIARWEGDEMVIETINQRGLIRPGPQGFFLVSPQAQVTERLKFLSPDEILYAYSITDPVMYATPWRAEFVLTRSKVSAIEYSCHEGNYSIGNMLAAARSAARRAAAKAKP